MSRSTFCLGLLFAAACARGGGARSAPEPSGDGGLPPIPLVDGPLAPRVQYPPAEYRIPVRDSTFLFGDLGSGRARLTVNGIAVPVLPNGAWIAYLPVPPADAPRYEIVAVRDADTVRVVHPVVVPPAPLELAAAGPLLLDSASVTPNAGWALPDDELVEVGVRGPADATIWIEAGGDTLPLLAMPSRPGVARWSRAVPASALRDTARVIAARGADTVRLAVPRVASVASHWAELGGTPSVVSDTDRVVIARPILAGTYKWFFLPGTRVLVTARFGPFVRVRVDDALEVWVAAADVTPLPEGTPPPSRVTRNARVEAADEWVDLVIPVGDRPPHLVEELPRGLALTLYGTRATTDIIRYPTADTLVRFVRWEPVAADRVVYTVQMSQAPYGYLVFWRDGAVVLRIRRPPVIDRSIALRGLTIAVDAGHPPAGATGPTGLYEATATLPIARFLQTELESRGASVVMMRTDEAPVALGDRPIMARRANAHALVSIHLNALPDGVNPFTAHGTGTYYFHPHAEPLARAVQRGMVHRMGLRDLGIYYDNLALVRPTWMPAILCEGAFIMMPEQEAALRTAEFQARYARGVADGLERYFASLRRSR